MSVTLTALLFPGQGGQRPGMLAEVARRRPELLEETEAVAAERLEPAHA